MYKIRIRPSVTKPGKWYALFVYRPNPRADGNKGPVQYPVPGMTGCLGDTPTDAYCNLIRKHQGTANDLACN